jgi:hypothetical protein
LPLPPPCNTLSCDLRKHEVPEVERTVILLGRLAADQS